MADLNKLLDEVLGEFYINNGGNYSIPHLHHKLVRNNSKIDIDTLMGIIDILEGDKYLKRSIVTDRFKNPGKDVTNETEPFYHIPFLGVLFYENGGYFRQASDKTALTRRVASNERNIYISTVIMGIGTGGLLLLEIIKFVIARLDLVLCNCN